MNFDQAVKLLPKLNIRNKDGELVPFVLNPSQKLVCEKLREQWARGEPIRALVLKARQVGVSTLTEGLLTAFAAATPNARVLILAHLHKSSRVLFEMAQRMRDSFPVYMPPGTSEMMEFPHPEGNARVSVATAGSKMSGRGMALSACHFSEAAHYPGMGESFTSLLPAIPYRKNTMVIVETTANGKEGDGETFWKMWLSAMEGRSNYIPIFIPWTMDSTCVSDPSIMEGGFVDEEEEELAASGVTMGQLAWRRQTIENESRGLIDKFHQEYPISWEEAFVSSGSPAFNRAELAWARKCKRKPDVIMEFSRDLKTGATQYAAVDPKERKPRPSWHLWEKPKKGDKYYIGADSARGTETGDYSVAALWNGNTGDLAGCCMGRFGPEELASQIDMVAREYNRALVNIELTGGFGTWTQTSLRDKLKYTNLYRWKGRDDKTRGATQSKTIGWETTHQSRRLMFTAFREGLRAHRIKPFDERLLAQIENAVYDENWRWEMETGHDDVLVAAMVGWIAVEQYPPTRIRTSKRVLETVMDSDKTTEEIELSAAKGEESQPIPRYDLDPVTALRRHWRRVRRGPSVDRLKGV